MNVVEKITTLVQEETVRLNPDQLGTLYRKLGDASAEDVICRAVEEMAVRLTTCERLWRDADYAALRKSVRSLAAISEQVGMDALAAVARDVIIAIDADDTVATAATLFRLVRVGERSLTAVWDLRDMSI